MAIDHVTDHADRAVNRLVQHFREGVTFPALVRALVSEFQELEEVFQDLLTERTLDSAVGAQLDTIGAIVGQERGGRDDATYRIWIRARMRLNKSCGTAEDVLAVFSAITQGSTALILEEQYPAAFVLKIGAASIIAPAELAALLAKAKAAGVNAVIESATSDDPNAFAFDPGGAGFGTADASTDSTAAVGIGVQAIPVTSESGFVASDAIVVEPGENEEERVVQSVAAGSITVSVALARAHASGVEIRKTPNTGGRMAAAF